MLYTAWPNTSLAVGALGRSPDLSQSRFPTVLVGFCGVLSMFFLFLSSPSRRYHRTFSAQVLTIAMLGLKMTARSPVSVSNLDEGAISNKNEEEQIPAWEVPSDSLELKRLAEKVGIVDAQSQLMGVEDWAHLGGDKVLGEVASNGHAFCIV